MRSRPNGASSRRSCITLDFSCREIKPFVERPYEAIRGWFHRLEHFFEPDCPEREEVTVNEAKLDVDGREVYVRAAADCETLEALDMEVSPSRSNFDALVFLGDGLARGGRPLVRTDRGSWYDWPLDRLNCEV